MTDRDQWCPWCQSRLKTHKEDAVKAHAWAATFLLDDDERPPLCPACVTPLWRHTTDKMLICRIEHQEMLKLDELERFKEELRASKMAGH